MSKRKKHKRPADPAEIARRAAELAKANKDPSRWGIDPAVLAHAVNDDINVGKDAAGRVTRAKRWDTFALLRTTYRKGKDGQTVSVLTGDHIICIDKFHKLLALRYRTAGAAAPFDVMVDGLIATDYPKAAVEAGVRLDGLVAYMNTQERAYRLAKGIHTPPCRAALLMALSVPTIVHGQRVNNWRKLVQQITGEHRDDNQSSEVASACDGLEAAVAAGADEAALKAYYARKEKEKVAA